jgi:hypothetical protein
MKKIITFIATISLTSCLEPNVGYHGQPATVDSSKTVRNIEVEFSVIPLTVVVIDSCEYLYGPWGNGTVLCHKGNCKNHIHK